MKNKLIKLLLYCIGAIVLFYTSVWLFFQFNLSFPSYFTVYSEGFNEESFKKITVGEYKKVVDSLLGEPLIESVDNRFPDSIMDIYWYTKAKPIGLSYDKIFIFFYEDKVSNIIRVIDMD